MIYLDHAAATPMSTKAKIAMEPYFSYVFFNPSAPYLPAVKTRETYEDAKSSIAHIIGGKGVDLVITAGATESINLAFTAIDQSTDTEILISDVEHPSVVSCAQAIGNFDTIKVDKNGRVILEDLAAKITNKTGLVSVCLASSELGTIQPLSEISAIVKRERQNRLKNNNKTPIYLHCDASQGLGLIDVKVARLGVDMLSINSAKIYGPKGIGALWANHNVKLKPIVFGGGQEKGVRSGTENVAGVMGFAAAICEAEKHISSERKRVASLRDYLKNILSKNTAIKFLGNPKTQLVNYLPISIDGLDAERLIFKLEQQDVYVSTGAACAASKGTKSHTLQAIGLNDTEIAGSLRLTLGKLNNESNIKQAAEIILDTITAEQERQNVKK